MFIKFSTVIVTVTFLLGLESGCFNLNAAHADDVEVQMSIKTTNFDMSDHTQVEALYRQVVIAATQVCAKKEIVGFMAHMSPQYLKKKCVRRSVINAVQRAKIAELTAVHKTTPRRARYWLNTLTAYQIAEAQ